MRKNSFRKFLLVFIIILIPFYIVFPCFVKASTLEYTDMPLKLEFSFIPGLEQFRGPGFPNNEGSFIFVIFSPSYIIQRNNLIHKFDSKFLGSFVKRLSFGNGYRVGVRCDCTDHNTGQSKNTISCSRIIEETHIYPFRDPYGIITGIAALIFGFFFVLLIGGGLSYFIETCAEFVYNLAIFCTTVF